MKEIIAKMLEKFMKDNRALINQKLIIFSDYRSFWFSDWSIKTIYHKIVHDWPTWGGGEKLDLWGMNKLHMKKKINFKKWELNLILRISNKSSSSPLQKEIKKSLQKSSLRAPVSPISIKCIKWLIILLPLIQLHQLISYGLLKWNWKSFYIVKVSDLDNEFAPSLA